MHNSDEQNWWHRLTISVQRHLFGPWELDLSGAMLQAGQRWSMRRVLMVFLLSHIPPIFLFVWSEQTAGEIPWTAMVLLHPLLLLLLIRLAAPRETSQIWSSLEDISSYRLLDMGLKWGIIFRVITFATVLLQVTVGLEPPPSNNPLQLAEQILSPFEQGFIALIVVVLVPAAEEIFYRKILYQSLGNYVGLAAAATLSSAIWALLHGSMLLVPALFALGICLTILYESTKNIWVPIAAHMAFNLTSFILLWVLPHTAG